MTLLISRTALLCLLVALLCGPVMAEDIYVKNRLYKGQTYGQGLSTELAVDELAAGLGLEAVSDNGYWKIGDLRVPGREHDGKFFVILRDLKDAGLIVIHSPKLETIDLSLPKSE